jgi:hypothetical protein
MPLAGLDRVEFRRLWPIATADRNKIVTSADKTLYQNQFGVFSEAKFSQILFEACFICSRTLLTGSRSIQEFSSGIVATQPSSANITRTVG